MVLVGFGGGAAGERRGRMSAQFSALRALWRHGDGAASSRPASPGHEACGKPSVGVGVDGDQWSWLDIG